MLCGDWTQISERGAQSLAQGICGSACQSLELTAESREEEDDRPREIIPKELYGGIISSRTIRELKIGSTVIDMTSLAPIVSPPPDPTGPFIQLESLDIWSCALTVADLELLSYSLQNNEWIRNLSLASCEIDDDGVAAFSKHLQESVMLESLSLSGNLFGPNGTRDIMKTIANFPTLWVLNLSYNIFMGLQNLEVIGTELPHVSIGILKCAGCCTNNGEELTLRLQACQALANGLFRNDCLRELVLDSNFLGAAGVNVILKGLASHPTLFSLNLSLMSAADDDDVKTYFGLELSNLNVENLCLLSSIKDTRAENDEEGVRDAVPMLAVGLANNKSVQELNLACNFLSPPEVRLLIRGLSNHPTLKKCRSSFHRRR